MDRIHSIGWLRRGDSRLLLGLLLTALLQLQAGAAGLGELEVFNDPVAALGRVRGSGAWATMALHMGALGARGVVPVFVEITLIDP